MISTKPFTGTVSIIEGKITKIDLSLVGESLSEVQQIMALKQILKNYIKEYERSPERRK